MRDTGKERCAVYKGDGDGVVVHLENRPTFEDQKSALQPCAMLLLRSPHLTFAFGKIWRIRTKR